MMKKKVVNCENCQTRLQGEYCYVCGQRGIEIRRPVIGLAQDILVETLAIDGKLWRTVIGLFVNPGKVAKNYISGHRVRYSPPFRSYLFFSLVFFATTFWLIGREGLITDADAVNPPDAGVEESFTTPPTNSAVGVDALPDDPQSVPLSAPNPGEQAEPSAVPTEPAREDAQQTAKDKDIETSDAHPDSGGIIDVDLDEDSWANVDYNGPAFLEGTVRKIFENIKAVEEDPRLFMANVKDNIPRVLLLMPLVYVFLLLIFYFYKKNTYVYDILVISLYMHAALYFYFFISLAFQVTPLNNIAIVNWFPFLLIIWAAVQPFRMLATNFNSKWYGVMLKGGIINTLYWIAVFILIMAGMALSLVY